MLEYRLVIWVARRGLKAIKVNQVAIAVFFEMDCASGLRNPRAKSVTNHNCKSNRLMRCVVCGDGAQDVGGRHQHAFFAGEKSRGTDTKMTM